MSSISFLYILSTTSNSFGFVIVESICDCEAAIDLGSFVAEKPFMGAIVLEKD